jgi:hypothetical protein
MVSLKLMAGAARSMVVASESTTAVPRSEIHVERAMVGAKKVRGEE